MNPKRIKLPYVHETAKKFLREHHPQLKLPIPIEEIVELRMGIALAPVAGIKSLLGIDAFLNSAFTEIVIDDYSYTHYIERTRFSVAHEVGHFILHKDWYEKVGPKDIKNYSRFFKTVDQETYNFAERQASTFAGLILVPPVKLKAEFFKYVDPESKLPAKLETVIKDIFPNLALQFKVSPEALLVSLKKEGLVSA